ncbi:GGDEF domain-containing protein [Mycetocola miduiensis]|uniref:Diguanylate cyclase (GGDEF) domain-containing protein n=1 Tax=Mycetocola miduiensis TaxID=995034 RepID=A0A1I4YG46_9MICO|nr:GGDEF domain-containing protein [Mycetocola miduiensis]SFN36580.1 diguanylate cyclase (GGDEF) domain-containing protein [Mycetocola miduiensis]
MTTAADSTAAMLDLQTLLISSGMVVAICGASFVLNTVFGRNDPPGRLWSAGFIAGILTSISYAIWGSEPSAWWATVVGNASLVLAMGCVWSGSRIFNGRSSRLAFVLGGSAVAAVAAVIESPHGGAWAGGFVFLFGVAVFAALAGVESLRGRMRRNLNARVLAILMLIVGGYYGTRAVVFLVATPDSELFREAFGTAVTTFVTILFVIIASTSMSLLRTERSGTRMARPIEAGNWNGILPDAMFSTPAADRIRRATKHGEHVAFIGAEIDNMADMNTAFGRSFGDDTIESFSSILQDYLPTTAIIGRRAGAQFACVVMADDLDQAYDIIERVRAALVDEPIENSTGIRLSVSWGVVMVEPDEPDVSTLTAQVRSLVKVAQEAGGNRIAGSPTPTESGVSAG